MTTRALLVPVTLAVTLLLLPAAPVQAALAVIQPVALTPSTQNGGFDRLAAYLIDGSGLSDPSIVQTGSPVPVAWPTHNNGASAVAWMNAPNQPPANQWVIFDLGTVQPVRGMHVWNYNEVNLANGRSIQDMEVSFATSLGSLVPTDPNWSSSTAVTLAPAPGNNAYQGDSYALPDANARYVLFDIQSVYGSGDFYGLSEVRFMTPEPTKSLLLAIGAMTLFMRRRRSI